MTIDRNFPYVLLVNVAIADLQNLRDKAEEATRKLATSAPLVMERNEAVYFCFEKPQPAAVFQGYCVRNQIPHRRLHKLDDHCHEHVQPKNPWR